MNYTIDFTKENTIRDLLGFDAEIIRNELNISKRMVNVVLTNKIFIKCDIIKGAIL